MAPISVQDIADQVDKLIAEYEGMRAKAKYDDLSDLKLETETFVVRLRAAIERLAPAGSTYIKEMTAAVNHNGYSTGHRLRIYIGILQALKSDADEGWLQGVSELLHADTLSDFIEQADELTTKAYHNAGAVIVGSALEAHLRLLCIKHGINLQNPNGSPLNANAMNAELAKAAVYNTLQQKQVESWQAIRNAAAHGDYAQYKKEQVITMISSIRDFILAYPA
jgi:hypothetical protein